MKTSNKILIAFAGALILIPLLGMIYVSQVKYKTGEYTDEWKKEAKAKENFNTPLAGMESIAISTPFESINIEDARKAGILIHFIADENFGVKVRKEDRDSLSFNVDAKGTLQISFLNKKTDNDRHYTTILVYGKSMKQIDIVNASSVFLDTKSDTLTLNVKRSSNIHLQRDLSLIALQVNTDEVEELYVSEVDIKSLTVNLNGTNFKSKANSYDNLSISSTGKSELEVSASDEDNGHSIKNLIINTLGEARFKLKNIKVEKCSGSFSDQTQVEMPAANLNQMYRK